VDELKEHITASLGDAVDSADIAYGELTINARRTEVVKVISFLRDDPMCKFNLLIDIAGADYPARDRRFDVVYHMLSMSHNVRIRMKITTDAGTPVDSISGIFPNADWYEREAFDMEYSQMLIGMSAKPLICMVSSLMVILICAVF